MVIAHNLTAMNAQRQFNIVGTAKKKSTEKLSSGYKINRAADDAAGLAISEKMRRQIKGLNRGVENCQDGVSACQVADGALAEVQDMLQRLTQLSVQAANGTNSDFDRNAIQKEINQIISEVDRIGDTTKFNELHVFKGEEEHVKVLKNSDGTNAYEGDIPFSDFKLADISIGLEPFGSYENPNYMDLVAKVNNKDSAFYGKEYNLIYGSGGTSESSFKLHYWNPADSQYVEEEISLSSLDYVGSNYNESSNTWTRSYKYTNSDGVDISLYQNIKTTEGAEEKYYNMDYEFVANNEDIETSIEFMFHVDTAYNNDDRCEGYFVDGDRVNNNCIYANDRNMLTYDVESDYIHVDTDVPNSFSIYDVDRGLDFTEKISFTGSDNNRPYAISIGHYSRIRNWDYYDKDVLNSNLGGNTEREDLGFSLYYAGAIGTGSRDGKSVTFSLNYGIAAIDKDKNMEDVPVKKDRNEVILEKKVIDTNSIWIQSGADAGDGIVLKMKGMNSSIIGINDLNVRTEDEATAAIDKVGKALAKVSEHRSMLGAQQNRLEHTISNEKNIVENTQAAESLIRDTDMATEMVEFTKNNILEQAVTSMLAQANQSTQGVMALLQ